MHHLTYNTLHYMIMTYDKLPLYLQYDALRYIAALLALFTLIQN